MRLSESRIRRIIREEIDHALRESNSGLSTGDSDLRQDVALVLSCFTGKELKGFTAAVLGEIMNLFPEGHAVREVAKHYQPMMYSVVKYLNGIDDDQFVTLPDEFIPTLVDKVDRANPEVASRLLTEYYKVSDVNWYDDFGIIAEGAQAMSDWITGSRDYENFHDYADGFEIMRDHRDDVKRLVDLMRAGPVIARFLSNHDDDETVDKIISLVVSGPDGVIQAGELASSLGEM